MIAIPIEGVYPLSTWKEMCRWFLDNRRAAMLRVRYPEDDKGYYRIANEKLLRQYLNFDMDPVPVTPSVLRVEGPDDLMIWFRMKFL